MMRSMTGYGKASAKVGNKTINVEVRSLNSKQLDLNLRLPSLYRQKEIEIRNLISTAIVRGKVDFTIGFENQDTTATSQLINKTLFKAYYDELSALAREYNLPNDNLLATVLAMPGIMQNQEDNQLTDEEWEVLKPALTDALKDHDSFRLKEGAELKKDFVERINIIQQLTGEVEQQEPARVVRVRERLNTGLADMKAEGKLDANRLEQEMIYYIEKLDVTEEIVRLKGHCVYMLELLDDKELEKGRKLAFMSQELGREINTIGSKANDAGMQKQVVAMKEQLEKIKEQLNNIL